MLFSLCKHIIAIKKRKISVCFFLSPPLAAGIRRDSTLLPPASGCRAVKGCRDCVGSRALQLAFSHLSACLSAEMTDGRELRADGGPQRAPMSVCVWRTKEEEDGQRTRRNRGWLLITWRGVGFSVKVFFFFLEQISLYKCSSTILQFHQNGRSPSFTSFACSVPSQACDRSSRERLSLQKAANRGLTGLFLLSCSTAVQLFNKTSYKLVV